MAEPTTDNPLVALAERLVVFSRKKLNTHAADMVQEAAGRLLAAAKWKAKLEEFCRDVDAMTLERNEDGYAAPVGTDGWSDLGKTYLDACALLGREPAWAEGETPGTWEPPADWDDEGEA